MKVECAACQAKYQIPDERVAGRKLKIRCRKCGGAIVVRGDQLEAPPAEPAPDTGPAPDEWHVSIDGSQHGPYPTEQMAAMLHEGQLAWDAHVWRDGYADWKTAGDSDTLVRAVASVNDTQETQPAVTSAVASAPAFEDEATRMVVGSVPPDELQPVARSAFAARAAHQQSQPPGAGIAAGRPERQQQPERQQPSAAVVEERPVHEPAPVYAAAQSALEFGGYNLPPRVSPVQALTGERHEDSVLFSAHSLASSRVASSPSVQQRAGYAGGEGSGLIDIRALAALARTSQNQSGAGASNGAATNGVYTNGVHANGLAHDDLMAIAHQTGAFTKLDSLAPIDHPKSGSNNAVPLAIVAGSAMVAAAAFLAVYLTRTPAPSATVPAVAAAVQPVAEPGMAEQPSAPRAEAKPADLEPEPVRAEPEPAKAEDEPVRAAAPARQEHAKTVAATRASGRATKPARATKDEPLVPEKPAARAAAEKTEKKGGDSLDDLLLADSKPAKAEKAAAPPADDPLLADAPAPAKPEPPKNRSIDDLLDSAVEKGSKKSEPAAAAAAAPSSAAGLPETPTRDEVKAAMKAVEPDVKACAEGQTLESNTASVALTVSGSTGRVSGVRVTGIQGPVGSCIARAVRNASFPKFAKSQFSINFPFRLK